jgi:hypothetical protein
MGLVWAMKANMKSFTVTVEQARLIRTIYLRSGVLLKKKLLQPSDF